MPIAIIATIASHIVVFSISFYYLKKYVSINFGIIKFIIKPILATFMMGIVSLYTYNYLIRIITENMAIIITLMIAGVIYFLSIISLKIL